jgi:hypothetical protein
MMFQYRVSPCLIFHFSYLIHLSSISHPSLIHLSSISHPSLIHLSSISHPSLIHLSSISHPSLTTHHHPSLHQTPNLQPLTLTHPLSLSLLLHTLKLLTRIHQRLLNPLLMRTMSTIRHNLILDIPILGTPQRLIEIPRGAGGTDHIVTALDDGYREVRDLGRVVY